MLKFELANGEILEVPEGTLVDTHPVIQARRQSPNSRKDHKQIVRAGGNYEQAPSHDWGTHGGTVSSDEFNALWGHGTKGTP